MVTGSTFRMPWAASTPLLPRWWGWAALSIALVLVALDHITGPYVRVSIGFVLPVAMVAYRWDWTAGLGLGLILGVSRVWLSLGQAPWLVLSELVNLALSLLVFGLAAVAADLLARWRTTLRTEAFPICGGCARIRDGDGHWRRFESRVSTVTTATFTHTVCPECEARFSPAGAFGASHPNPPV